MAPLQGLLLATPASTIRGASSASTTMQAEVAIQTEAGEITEFVHRRRRAASDEKQITDIEDLLGQDCNILIVSPNTTAALTPAVEQACDSGIPVVVFDRGVNTDCPVTFIHPIGGYAFGADAAEFLVDNVADRAATSWRCASSRASTCWRLAGRRPSAIFEQSGLNVVGVEFTDGDAGQDEVDRDRLPRPLRHDRRRLDGRGRDSGRRRSKRSRTPASMSRRSPARTSRLPDASGRTTD